MIFKEKYDFDSFEQMFMELFCKAYFCYLFFFIIENVYFQRFFYRLNLLLQLPPLFILSRKKITHLPYYNQTAQYNCVWSLFSNPPTIYTERPFGTGNRTLTWFIIYEKKTSAWKYIRPVECPDNCGPSRPLQVFVWLQCAAVGLIGTSPLRTSSSIILRLSIILALQGATWTKLETERIMHCEKTLFKLEFRRGNYDIITLAKNITT